MSPTARAEKDEQLRRAILYRARTYVDIQRYEFLCNAVDRAADMEALHDRNALAVGARITADIGAALSPHSSLGDWLVASGIATREEVRSTIGRIKLRETRKQWATWAISNGVGRERN